MHFNSWMLLFPIVLGIHNWEEYRRFEEFIERYHQRLPARLANRTVVLAAMILVTAAAAALVLSSYVHRTPVLRSLSRVAVFALLINAFGHCALSLLRRQRVAGTLSAIGLVLPFSAIALYAMHADLGDSVGALTGYAALGALAMPIIILASLLGGLACSHGALLIRRVRR